MPLNDYLVLTIKSAPTFTTKCKANSNDIELKFYPGTTLYFAYFPMLQGNLSGGYNGPQLFTYWDDYIWATTKAEVDLFLGPDTTPPQISGASVNGTTNPSQRAFGLTCKSRNRIKSTPFFYLQCPLKPKWVEKTNSL